MYVCDGYKILQIFFLWRLELFRKIDIQALKPSQIITHARANIFSLGVF